MKPSGARLWMLLVALTSATFADARLTAASTAPIVTPATFARSVRVRKAADINAPVVGWIEQGQRILCRRCPHTSKPTAPAVGSDEKCQSHGHPWYSVVLRDGKAGFACSQYLRSVEDREIEFEVRFPDDRARGAAIVIVKNSVEPALVVIDGGGTENGLRDYLRRHLHSMPIGLAVVTNPLKDHWLGFERLIRNGQVGFLLASSIWPDCATDFAAVTRGLRKNQIRRLSKPSTGFTYFPSAPEVGVRLLWAGEICSSLRCSRQLEAASLVLQVRIRRHTFLFPSDIRGRKPRQDAIWVPSDQEYKLLMTEKAQQAMKSDVLLVPHHGDDVASTVKFIKAVCPSFAIICEDSSQERKEVADLYHDKVHAKVLKTFDNPRLEERGIICFPDDDGEIACKPGPLRAQGLW